MEKSRLFEVFRSFTKEEMNEFARFLHSPFFNESRNTAKLFEILRQYHPGFNSRSIEPAKIYAKIFRKNKDMNLNSLNNLFTRLNKLTDKYIGFKGFQNNKMQYDLSCLGELKQRGLNTLFRSRYKTALEKTYVHIESSSDLDLHKYLIGYMETDYLLRNVYKGKNTNPCISISSNLNDLLKFFYINLFRSYCRLVLFRSLFISEGELNARIVRFRVLILQMPEGLDMPVLQLYSKFTKIYEPSERADFFSLRSALFENDEHIEREDFILMLKMLFEFGAKLYENGDNNCGKQVFELLKIVNRRKLWHDHNGKLTEYSFSNTILFALRFGEFQWAHKFIFDNADFIDSDDSKEIVDYNLACYHFYRAQAQIGDTTNDYELALDHISKVNSHFYMKRLSIFDILIITYYELDEIDRMFYQSDSYSHYLKVCRNLIPPPLYGKQQNFNKLAHTLGKLKSDFRKKEFEKLAESINKEENCAHKDWLLRKIALLKKQEKSYSIH